MVEFYSGLSRRWFGALQAITAATFRVGKKTLGGTALRKTVFGGEAHKLRQSKSARANYGRPLRSRSLVDCAKPRPCSFGRRRPLHLDCQECGERGRGVAGGIARSDPRKSWDRTQSTVSLHCVSWMTSLSAAGAHLGATRTASRPEGPIAPLILMMTTNNDCFPMLLASTLYQGSADSHSGIGNGGSEHVVEADCGSIWRKNFLPENRISSNLRPPLPSVSSIAATSLSGWSSGITLAGTVVLTLLCSLIFSSTSGPAPSHCTVYSPAGSCVFPAIVVD